MNDKEFKQEFIEGTYYKASIICLNGFYNVKALKSYNTIITFNINNKVIVNKDFYKCSGTTKRHYNIFLDQYTPATKDIIYLNENKFYDIEKLFFNKETNKFCEVVSNIITKYYNQKEIIETLKAPLNPQEIIEELKYKNLELTGNELIKLKTRIKNNFYYKCNNIKFCYTITINKNKSKILKEQIKILDEGTTADNTKPNDLIYYNSYDILESSNKSDYIINNEFLENYI